MANNSTTPDDEKSAHQQRIEEMLAEHDAIARNLSAVDAWTADDDSRWSCIRHHYEPNDLKREKVLAAEVRRLRDENRRLTKLLDICNDVHGHNVKLKAVLEQTREERNLFRTASEAAELRIVELREAHDMWKQQWTEMRDTMWKPAMAKLARVESVLSMKRGYALEDDIRAALRDEPQPEREPKLPFNGY